MSAWPPCGGSSSACPCETIPFPQIVCNPANLPTIKYRVGDYLSFRNRLLQALPGEVALTVWRPGAEGDLAVQMVEWSAYLGDILTFYNERIANEAYLGTAYLPASVSHLVQLLGYRPRPALGARAKLAAVLSTGARPPVSVPARLQVQSKPAPGKQPQVFELDQDSTVTAPDLISAVVSPANPRLLGADGKTLWLAGKVSGIKTGERLLLINAQALTAQTVSDYAWISVAASSLQTDPLGDKVTQVTLSAVTSTIAANAHAMNYVLLRPSLSGPLWGYPVTPPQAVVSGSGGTATVTLASVARDMSPGSLLLLDVSDGAASGVVTPTPVIVQTYAESVWYANGNGPSAPQGSPPPTPIGIPVAELGFAIANAANWATAWNNARANVTVRWTWNPVGTLSPVLTQADLTFTGGNTELVPAPGTPAFPTSPTAALLEDGNGNATAGTLNPAGAPPGAVTLTPDATAPIPDAGLASPITAMFDLLSFSRGKTVASEVLGSGNPAVAGQDFKLVNAPVTYLADPASISGDGFSSTVQVSVNGVRWQEVQSFYGQKPDAQVFVLREDDAGSTHVTFGDGVQGARLPTGTNNVVATYRYGAGAQAPAPQTLTVVQTPTPGLKGFRNPAPPTGGADPDSPARLSSLAPASVLTFNRAVSLDDYQAIAAGAPGVTQVLAEYVFDPPAQRPLVTLWIAGDSDALAQATEALAGITMPNQVLRIKAATEVLAKLTLTYVRDPRLGDTAVQAGLTTALLDPNHGVLGAKILGIGQTLYESQIAAACLAVPGVTAIHDVSFTAENPLQHILLRRFVGNRLTFGGMRAQPVACSGRRWNPGAGSYFSVPNDGQHLKLNGAVAS
jgi:predicted phage baseplate assembly protein